MSNAAHFAYTHRERNRDRMWTRMFAVDARADQGGKCAYCHKPMNREDATGDHVDPLAKGGSTNRKNIKASCRPCNWTKGNQTEKAFIARIKSPRKGDSIHIWEAWYRRSIWLRTERACKRIMALVT